MIAMESKSFGESFLRLGERGVHLSTQRGFDVQSVLSDDFLFLRVELHLDHLVHELIPVLFLPFFFLEVLVVLHFRQQRPPSMYFFTISAFSFVWSDICPRESSFLSIEVRFCIKSIDNYKRDSIIRVFSL